jgi:predicted metal-dependent hydrolase
MEYEIRRSRRARRVHVRVQLDGSVEVVLPERSPQRAAARAVRELRPWIDQRRALVAEAQAAREQRDGWLPYLDERLTLVPQPTRRRVHRRGAELLVPADPDSAGPALERWYRRVAHKEITARLDGATAAVGSSYSGLTIRAQRTRWASCSPSGAMSFNWRLMLAPSDVLDYVVWHEVCHLDVLDHSPRFWSLLAERLPGYEAPRAWLRRHGAELVL